MGGVVVEALGTAATDVEDPVGTVEGDEGEATAAIEPLRSHGFGGEPIVFKDNDQIGTVKGMMVVLWEKAGPTMAE